MVTPLLADLWTNIHRFWWFIESFSQEHNWMILRIDVSLGALFHLSINWLLCGSVSNVFTKSKMWYLQKGTVWTFSPVCFWHESTGDSLAFFELTTCEMLFFIESTDLARADIKAPKKQVGAVKHPMWCWINGIFISFLSDTVPAFRDPQVSESHQASMIKL